MPFRVNEGRMVFLGMITGKRHVLDIIGQLMDMFLFDYYGVIDGMMIANYTGKYMRKQGGNNTRL